MKTHLSLFLFVTAAASWGWSQTTTTATAPTSVSTDLPVVGLGAGETLEIDIVNNASNSSNGTAASCTGTISFLNSTGATIGSSTAITNLGAGHVLTATLPFASSGGTGNRTPVRAVVTLNLPTTTPRPPCALQITMALFETSNGDTHAVVLTSGALAVGGPVPVSGRF